MIERERVQRTLNHQSPDRAPRELWALPGIAMYRRDELDALLARYPSDFASPDVTHGTGPDVQYGTGYKTRGTPAVVGTYVDEWGCPFTVAEPGVIGEVKAPPLADWSALDHLKAPDEILELADFSRVDAGCAATGQVRQGRHHCATLRAHAVSTRLGESLHGPGLGRAGGVAAT